MRSNKVCLWERVVLQSSSQIMAMAVATLENRRSSSPPRSTPWGQYQVHLHTLQTTCIHIAQLSSYIHGCDADCCQCCSSWMCLAPLSPFIVVRPMPGVWIASSNEQSHKNVSFSMNRIGFVLAAIHCRSWVSARAGSQEFTHLRSGCRTRIGGSTGIEEEDMTTVAHPTATAS
jgi:hypothetical protein